MASPMCSLLDSSGIAVQGLLGLAALSSLAYKRRLETPRRPRLIWLFDTSKQAISSGVGHLQNVGLSEILLVRIVGADTSPCAWYIVNLVLDVTLGTCATYWLLRSAEVVLSACADHLPGGCAQALLETAGTGHYGAPPQVSRWGAQLVLWLCVVTLAKLVVSLSVLVAATPLHDVGLLALRPFEQHPRVRAFLVFLWLPLCLNVVQLWVQDNFLRLRPFSARGTREGIRYLRTSAEHEHDGGRRGAALGSAVRGDGAVMLRSCSPDELASVGGDAPCEDYETAALVGDSGDRGSSDD
jgi:hypothetical protein